MSYIKGKDRVKRRDISTVLKIITIQYMKEDYSSVYKAFINTSALLFIISLFSSGQVSYGSSIAGYSVLTLGIMMILLNVIQNIQKTSISQNSSTFKLILSMMISVGPLFFLLMIIGFMLYLIINYQTIILSGHYTTNYTTFSNMTILLLLVQVYLIHTNMENQGNITSTTSGLLFLLSIVTSMCSLTLFTILKYFQTDGFRVT
jgi:hypothetical protein